MKLVYFHDTLEMLIEFILLFIVFQFHIAIKVVGSVAYDQNGYIIYCPCMGRFGNQAEQLLGSLFFAKLVNRTLVLPPFIEYIQQKPQLVNFDDILQVSPIEEFHRVITMDTFVHKLKDNIWPSGRQTFFCHSPRNSEKSSSCDALNGDPFKTFWTSFNISEDAANFYAPLTIAPRHSEGWQTRYPSNSWPVIAFVGAPSSFPTHEDSIPIQKYLKFSTKVAKQARKFQLERQFFNQTYVAIHIRHGNDWQRACDLLKSKESMTKLFSSAQCTGYESSLIPLNYNICMPEPYDILVSLKSILSSRGISKKISAVYVATDRDDLTLWDYLVTNLPDITLITPKARYSPGGGWKSQAHLTKPSPIVDAFLLSNADQFIGNCISSFSAFAARLRKGRMRLAQTTHYFNWYSPNYAKKALSDEL